MDRRQFLMTGAALSATALLPNTLLAESTKKKNAEKFSKPLAPIVKGDVKEYHLFIDIFQQTFVPAMKIQVMSPNSWQDNLFLICSFSTLIYNLEASNE